MALEVEIVDDRVELVDAAAVLLPVDGPISPLRRGAASGLRAALAPDERASEIDHVEHELSRMRPLAHPQAKAIDGVARWSTIIVSAAYPHNVDGSVFSADDCARMLRSALPVALA